ncbi:hypothetical protein B4U79_18409 [Dinothrombium tinctorium]|uniref:Uncharacterized protein n=1 Tax=Dinothrombium tinctorium TaxID=1965070 RepID=A0A3S3NJ50_9ACAR|nr:hypothetical protein B4U79_18409 [Dinothrombium tinctorium]
MRRRKKQITIENLEDLKNLEIISLQCPQVKVIEFTAYEPFFSEALSILKRNLKCIEHMKLDEGFSYENLFQITQLFDLKSLRLEMSILSEMNGITDNCLSTLLSRLSKLEALHLVYFDTFQFRNTINSLSSMHYLKDLTLDCIEISKNEFSFLLKEKGKSLERLCVVNEMALDDASFYLQAIFDNCTKLEFLHFSFVYSQVTNFIIVNIPTLIELSLFLTHCKLSRESDGLQNLQKLRLSIEEQTNAEFFHLLSLCPALKSLSIKIASSLRPSEKTIEAIASLINLKMIEFEAFEHLDYVIQIITSIQNCRHFVFRKPLPEAFFLRIIEAFEEIANKRSNESFILKLYSRRDLLRPLPPNLKIKYLVDK